MNSEPCEPRAAAPSPDDPRRLARSALTRRYAAGGLVVAFLWVCAWLPLWLSRAVGAGLGYLTLALNRKRREIARINLALCFPRMDKRERERLLRAHFALSMQATLDHGYLAWRPQRHLLAKTRFTGLEHLQSLLGQRNVLLLAPHMVGLNFGGTMLSHHFPMVGMFKGQSDPWVNWVMWRARTRFGGGLIERDQGLRPLLKTLRAGLPVYYLADEDFGPEHSIFVPFFGVPAATLTTLGRLARTADAAVVPMVSRLLPGGRGYEVILLPPLADFPTGDEATDAARMNAVVEECIALAPADYLWTFKRFKTRPPGEPDLYPKKAKRRG